MPKKQIIKEIQETQKETPLNLMEEESDDDIELKKENNEYKTPDDNGTDLSNPNPNDVANPNPNSNPNDDVPDKPKKPKRVLNETQKANLAKGREIAMQKKKERDALINAQKAENKKRIEERRKELELLREEKRNKIENRIVEKAISIRKKQIKKEKMLEEISDDDTSITEIQKIKRASRPKKIVNNDPREIFRNSFIFV